LVRPFVFALPHRPPLSPGAEVESAFWVPLARLLVPSTHRDVTLPVPGGERTFPAYVLGRDIIWGMTERILTSFMSKLGDRNP